MGNSTSSEFGSTPLQQSSSTSGNGGRQPTDSSGALNNSQMAAGGNNVFSVPLPKPSRRAGEKSKPLIITTPTSASSLNGHHSPAAYGSKSQQFNYSSNSMFSPSLLSATRSQPASADTSHRRRSAAHRIHRSRLGLMPSVKYSPSIPTNLTSRGSVRIPPPDRTTPGSPLSVFSTKLQSVPSTENVLSELRQKREKRKRDEIEQARHNTNNVGLPSSTVSPSQTTYTDFKRPRHDSNNTTSSEQHTEFVSPSPVSADSKTDSQSNNASTPAAAAGVSPKRDGHLRTAIASSYSSSRRSIKRQCPDSHEEPLYKRSINMNYLSSSRDSSRRCSPALMDRDSESETGSRISVTPLPSLKNSPRSSPVPQSNMYGASTLPPTLVTPKIEARVIFPSVEEPISGFVATLEDRAHDDSVNRRRAQLLLGVKSEPTRPSTASQVVMPIVKPTITIPDEKETANTKASSNVTVAQSTGSTSQSISTSTADFNTPVPTTILQQLNHTLDSSLTNQMASGGSVAVISSSSDKEAPPPSYGFSTTTLSAEPSKSAESSLKMPSTGSVTFSLPTTTTSDAEKPVAGSATSAHGFTWIDLDPSTTSTSTSVSTAVATTTTSTDLTFGIGSLSSVPADYPQAVSVQPASTAAPMFSFNNTTPASSVPAFTFGNPSVTSAPASTGFAFGATQSASTTSLVGIQQPSTLPTFAFGNPKTDTVVSSASEGPKFINFGDPQSTASTNTSNLGSYLAATLAATTSAPAPSFSFSGGQVVVTSSAPSSSAPTPVFSFGQSTSGATSAPSLTFGDKQSAVSSAPTGAFSFGPQKPAAPTTSSGGFGFGASQSTAPAGIFGASATSTSSKSETAKPVFAFGNSATANNSQAAPFGQALTSSIFGASTDKPAATSGGFSFGATTTTAASTPFGAATASTASIPFGTTTTAASTPFGTATASTASIPFGTTSNSTNSIFGATATTAAAPFGGPAVGASLFGATTPFGSSATSTTTPQSAIGMFNTTTTTANGVFGSTNTPAFGSNISASKASGMSFNFGATATSSAPSGIFGQPPAASTASAKPAFNFGAPTNPPAFGAATTSAPSIFGASSNGTGSSGMFGAPAAGAAFGSSNSATSTPVFGASNTQLPAFGSTQPPAANPNPFGAQPTSDQAKPTFNFGAAAPPAFGSSAAVPQFGAGAQPPAATGGATMFSLGTSKAAPRRRTRR